ncbi:MAG: hypothetical protein F7B18_02825 [Desulfurococcales archaeon]|nr:hypothetical protein [Desulfurococcales archaeon]
MPFDLTTFMNVAVAVSAFASLGSIVYDKLIAKPKLRIDAGGAFRRLAYTPVAGHGLLGLRIGSSSASLMVLLSLFPWLMVAGGLLRDARLR